MSMCTTAAWTHRIRCRESCFGGKIPPKQEKLLLAWIALHEQELQENWYLANSTGECYRIPPLR
ncbi:DUF4160 domain-containing protein [Senegalimassilia anaerobia]